MHSRNTWEGHKLTPRSSFVKTFQFWLKPCHCALCLESKDLMHEIPNPDDLTFEYPSILLLFMVLPALLLSLHTIHPSQTCLLETSSWVSPPFFLSNTRSHLIFMFLLIFMDHLLTCPPLVPEGSWTSVLYAPGCLHGSAQGEMVFLQFRLMWVPTSILNSHIMKIQELSGLLVTVVTVSIWWQYLFSSIKSFAQTKCIERT